MSLDRKINPRDGVGSRESPGINTLRPTANQTDPAELATTVKI